MAYTYWNQLQMWGGGFFQGLYPHPTIANKIVARCDVAGFYELINSAWKLIGNFPQGQDNDWGGASFAWHPTDANIFWFTAGKYTTGSNSRPGSVYKTIDGGVTLTKLNFPSIPFGSNENQRRLAGERLVVCPTNPNILLLGTYSSSTAAGKGIYRSTDGGTSWSQIPFANLAFGQTIPAINDNNGQTSFAFDNVNPNICYCAIFGLGIVKSTDYGINWSFIDGPKYTYRLIFNSGKLYTAGIITGSGELSLDLSGLGGVSVYNGTTWSNLLSVDIAWIDINKFNNEITAGYHYDNYWRKSTNGGSTWVSYSIGNNYINTVSYQDDVPYPVGVGMGCFAYDKVTPDTVWSGDYYYIWRNKQYSVANSLWTNIAKGIENTVAYDSAFVGSDFYTAWYDIYAFKHDRGLAKTPITKLGGAGNASPKYPSALSISYCRDVPTKIAVVGSDYANISDVVVSSDSGTTWKTTKSGTLPSRVCISATNPNLWVTLHRTIVPTFTSDSGTSSNAVGTLGLCVPSGIYYVGAPIAADAVNGNKFWVINDNLGDSNYAKLYELTFSAGSFTVNYRSTLAASFDGAKFFNLKSIPGYLFVSCFDTGLYYSANGGVDFTKITAVQDARAICFGKAKTGLSNPTLYMYGIIGGIESLWESNDLGANWEAKLDPNPNSTFNKNAQGLFQPVTHISASQLEYGKVFIGTDGHGGFYSSDTDLSVGIIITPGAGTPGQMILNLIFPS